MAAIQFTADDRDERGFIKAPAEPRSLAELLPQIAPDADPTIRRQPPTRFELVSAAVVVPLLLIALLYLSSARYAAPAVAPIPTVAPSAPTAAPLPAAPPVAMLPAYAAPDGTQLGQSEATRAITPLAHYGSAWIQADVAGSGLIWLRAADFPALLIVGPDLAPRPTVAVAPYAPPAVQGLGDGGWGLGATPEQTPTPSAPAPTWDAPAFQRLLDATATAIYTTAYAIETETGQQAVVVPATPSR